MTAWQDWERDLDEVVAEPSPTEQVPAQTGRRGRRSARKRAARSEMRTVRRGYLNAAEGLSGLVMLVAAIVLVGVVVWLRLSSNGDLAAAASSTAVAVPTSAAESVRLVVDPHAGAEVLPPRSMPSKPPAAAGPFPDPAAAAAAFAVQACTWLPGDSEEAYRARLGAVATPSAAAGWQHGTAERVGCMQVSAAVQSNDGAAATAVLSAVQVYPDSADQDGMRAYRWASTVQLVAAGGTWKVTG